MLFFNKYCHPYIVFFVTFFLYSLSFNNIVFCESYPDFAGNYIECDTGWCEFENWELNVLSKWEHMGKGVVDMIYTGFFKIPKSTIKIKNKKPRILVYTGRSATDPRTLALVKLGQLPYSNDKVSEVDGREYDNVTYSKENVPNKLWTYEGEIPLKFMPIEGKTGMYLYKPTKDLADGLYAVDFGYLTAKGLEGLDLKPEAFVTGGSLKLNRPQTARPFIVGDIDNIQNLSESNGAKNVSTIVKIQTRLNELEYYSGPIDGNEGPRTSAAISSYQRDMNLEVDGMASEALLAHLEGKNASNSSEEIKSTSTPNEQETLEKSVEKAVDNLFNSIFGNKK